MTTTMMMMMILRPLLIVMGDSQWIVSSPLDDLCIDIWISVSQNPDGRLRDSGYGLSLSNTNTKGGSSEVLPCLADKVWVLLFAIGR